MRIGGFIERLELSLTNYCQLKCLGCPSLPSDSSRKMAMNFKKVHPVIKDLHLKEITVCGNLGEPSEHQEFAAILLQLAQTFPDAVIRVATNGEKIPESVSPEMLELFKNITFDIAVDGKEQGIHEMTRRHGNLEKVFKAIHYLKSYGARVNVVSTRHLKNEIYSSGLAEFIRNEFNLDVLFRDTTIITDTLRPPTQLSTKGDVSVLYGTKDPRKNLPDSDFLNLYIECNGDAYPCVSFHKNKTSLHPLNIYQFSDTISFLKKFKGFQKRFCAQYKECGDLRQCQVNCGVYINNFNYDTIDDFRD